MSFKSFITKKALQMKGVSAEKAEEIAKQIEQNPALIEAMKSLEGNKEVKDLFDNIQKEIEDKIKSGMPEAYASVLVMGKYKSQIAKYQRELAPIMSLMQR